MTTPSQPTAILCLGAIAGLGLIGGLAAACFAKAFGVVFLGEPRGEHAAHAHESGAPMRWPMVVLAAGCAGVALLAPFVLRGLTPVLAELTQAPADAVPWAMAIAISKVVVWTSLGLAALVGVLTWLRRRLLAGRSITAAVTWDCGYAQPTARMQYTASSFAQPLTHLFAVLLRTRGSRKRPEGLFPKEAFWQTHTPDLSRSGLFGPALEKLRWSLSRLRGLQQGQVQVYVLYIALTLLALLIWKLAQP